LKTKELNEIKTTANNSYNPLPKKPMKKIVQILLFIISYSPLYLILLFQNLNDNIYVEKTKEFIGVKELIKLNTTSIAFLALIIISISLYFLFFSIVLKSSTEKYTIKRVCLTNAP
jgi:uncharacterized protein (UPF0297 family)